MDDTYRPLNQRTMIRASLEEALSDVKRSTSVLLPCPLRGWPLTNDFLCHLCSQRSRCRRVGRRPRLNADAISETMTAMVIIKIRTSRSWLRLRIE
jgi:hypothetical protein